MSNASKITIEAWEALAPLDDLSARASIALIDEKVTQRAVPIKLQRQAQSVFNTRSNTPIPNSPIKRSGSVVASNESPGRSHQGKWRKDVPHPIETHQQFQDWYAKIEGKIEAEQEADYRLYLDQVSTYVQGCDVMLDRLEAARGLLREMDANYKFVEDNSRALQLACESMLDEQKHLIGVTEAISARLEYFRELERATQMLNSPGESIVLDPEFLDLLDRLDVCLEFLKANRNFRDAEIYLIRFQQCLTRSMTLIKLYFANTISELTTSSYETITKLASEGKAISETALHALLYTKFANAAQPHVRTLIYELEKRVRTEPEEYTSLLEECWTNWFASRAILLSDQVAGEIRNMDPAKADLVKLTRSGCNYLRAICTDEWTVFRDFFSGTASDQLYRYLESLCDHLFDFLRPRILHQQKLDVLCELCNVIQALMALDIDEEQEDEEDDAQYANETGDYVSSQGMMFSPDRYSPFSVTPTRRSFVNLPKSASDVPAPAEPRSLRFGELLQTILHDVQTRLVFRAQAIIQAEVLRYIPTAEDLDYPNKLTSSKRLSLWMAEKKTDGEASAERINPLESLLPDEETQKSWYPTLRRTLWVLAKLHTYVKNAIFEDFAGEAVTLCRQSLISASQRIAIKQGSPLDSQLFSVRHMLILKEMIRTIDLVQIERGADFFSMTDALSSLLRTTTSLFNPSAFMEAASKSMPNFAETMTDAKIDLDMALKAVCEDLIVQAGLILTAALRNFIQRSRNYLDQPATQANQVLDLTTQEWATPGEIKSLHDQFVAESAQGGLEAGFDELVGKFKLWLGDQRTVAVLIPPIQEEVMDVYNSFHNLVKSEYEFEVSSSLLSPGVLKDRLRTIANNAGSAGIKK